jgi:metal-responsive CopG/Arc/MetJ family transcriptional regulator
MPSQSYPGIPDKLLTEVDRIARAEDRKPGDVLSDMLNLYLKDQKWQKYVEAGGNRGLGLRPADIEARVNTAITEYRKGNGR